MGNDSLKLQLQDRVPNILKYLPRGQLIATHFQKNTEVFEDSIIATLRTNCEIKSMVANTVKELRVTLADIKRKSREDEFIQTIKNKIHNKDPNVPEVFSLCDDILLYNDHVVIPNSLQRKILMDFHMGHPGKNRTKSLVRCYVRGAFNKFPDFFVQAFKIVIDALICYCHTSYEMTDQFL